MKQHCWIQTYSGKHFYPFNPQPDQIDIVDIAHALALKCRYTGHCKRFYSVAEHCVHVSRNVDPDRSLWGLMHDAAEAYVSDVAGPVKDYIIGFREMENGIMRVIAEKYNLDPVWEPKEVKEIDQALLATEVPQVMLTDVKDFTFKAPPIKDLKIGFWGPELAKTTFLLRFKEIANGKVLC